MSGATERTDEQINREEPVIVTMAGQQFELSPRRGHAVTRQIRKAIGDLLPDAADIAQVVQQFTDGGAHEVDGELAGNLVKVILPLLGSGLDDLLDVIYIYSPEILADKERIEADGGATEAEYLTALMSVMALIYGPFVYAAGGAIAAAKQAVTRS